ncbi:hypothetical protein [Microbacterium sp. LWH13-1.2]|uniref:hypothetical protein n=1 Tax=Microbacterium sp. LWH13-1.2 TaxID=3135260 RepID=UPI00313A305A
MNFSDAVSALYELDALPELRRRYLTMLAADAQTDVDRALIVVKARDEERRVRADLAVSLKAEFADRARWAASNPPKPSGAAQKPVGGRRWTEEGTTHDGPRPVIVTWGPITRTPTEEQIRERRSLMGQNKKYVDKPVAKVKPEPRPRKQAPEHGLTAYNKNRCRCDVCRAAKSASRKKRNLRRPDGTVSPHGTISRYSNNKCRCDECRSAAAEYQREWRTRQRPN